MADEKKSKVEPLGDGHWPTPPEDGTATDAETTDGTSTTEAVQPLDGHWPAPPEN
ncbi:hypothetical protein AB0M28_05040 [Streptomyces sp. NPDC051940]|uniref:hypothetical protein n=1 Tax=Streptomyces sp. NPDC051940 TaxID=3155675 RepID=UPI00343A6CA5